VIVCVAPGRDCASISENGTPLHVAREFGALVSCSQLALQASEQSTKRPFGQSKDGKPQAQSSARPKHPHELPVPQFSSHCVQGGSAGVAVGLGTAPVTVGVAAAGSSQSPPQAASIRASAIALAPINTCRMPRFITSPPPPHQPACVPC
jgi:hypothetical protein